MKKLIRNIFLYINITLAVFLSIAYLSPITSPEDFWILAFFGLAYPYLLTLNFLFIVFWLVKRNKLFLISFVVIIIGYSYIGKVIQIRIPQKVSSTFTAEKEAFKMLSFNVKAFSSYKWQKLPKKKPEILAFLKEENPAIICFQEYYDPLESKGPDLHDELRSLPYSHAYFLKNTRYGVATYSRFPIVSRGEIIFKNTLNSCIYTDIKVNDDTLRVFNLHLQSIRMGRTNYQFMKKLQERIQEGEVKEIKDISYRLKKAFIKRSRQADTVAAHIQKSPYPVIVAGDFNDTPMSYTYHEIKKGLSDAFTESGHGLGQTYKGSFPSNRIDFILHDPTLDSKYFSTYKNSLSDHYPIACYIIPPE